MLNLKISFRCGYHASSFLIKLLHMHVLWENKKVDSYIENKSQICVVILWAHQETLQGVDFPHKWYQSQIHIDSEHEKEIYSILIL